MVSDSPTLNTSTIFSEQQCPKIPKLETDPSKFVGFVIEGGDDDLTDDDYDFLRNNNELNWEAYTRSAMRFLVPLAEEALQHFNSKTGKNWAFEKVTMAAEVENPGRVIHMNYLAKAEDGSLQLLFVEFQTEEDVAISVCTPEDNKYYFINGCCLLQKTGTSNSPNGYCGMCCDKVYHPGPSYGYKAADGDLKPCKYFYRGA